MDSTACLDPTASASSNCSRTEPSASKSTLPHRTDPQQPHPRDEVYVIVSGTGRFLRGEEEVIFERGDVLFAAAGKFHRFVDFSQDFVAWVFFYGPEGGEEERPSGQ